MIYLIIGPSGSGKTTLAEVFPQERRLVSFTTRAPRPGERDGIHYHFVTKDKALEAVKNDKVIEYMEYNNQFYGYLKDDLESKMSSGEDVVAVVNIDGLKSFLDSYVSDLCVPVFIDCSKETILRHFETRMESQEEKDVRIKLYDNEIKNKSYVESIGGTIFNIDNLSIEDAKYEFLKLIQKISLDKKKSTV